MYRIQNIRMQGNEHGHLRKDTIYGKLMNTETGEVEINATLEYILRQIRSEKIPTEGVTVEYKNNAVQSVQQ